MPLQIIERDNLSCPVIICDHCHQEIATAKEGNYQWLIADHGLPQPVFFTHKHCCYAFEDRRGGLRVLWGSMELTLLPIYLENNLRVSRKDAESLARTMASF